MFRGNMFVDHEMDLGGLTGGPCDRMDERFSLLMNQSPGGPRTSHGYGNGIGERCLRFRRFNVAQNAQNTTDYANPH